MQKNLRTGLSTLSLAAVALGLHACGGGGGGGQLELTDISVPNNAIWEINRPIELTFSEPVDFGSINANSISVRTPQGEPALGEFSLKVDSSGSVKPSVVVFQPRCPTKSDLSDAGLQPDSTFYILQVLGADITLGSAVKAASGATLAQSQQRVFTTPPGTTAQNVFLDTKLGSPGVVLRPKGAENITEATHIELFDGSKRYFEIDPLAPTGVAVEDFSATEPDYPINLFSDNTSQYALVVVFNQPVSPDDSNISSDRVELQFSTNGGVDWTPLDTTVELEANCTSAGARVRIEPIGVLPQDADLRVVVSADFQDIVGEQGLLPLSNFAPFRTRSEASTLFGDPASSDPDDPSKILADEIFESFTVGGTATGSFEQVQPTFPEPQAEWGDGRLKASFDFIGTGGPGGTFDWVVKAGTTELLTTETDTINGGPGFTTGQTQTVVNGIVNVANLRVEEGATLRITGPNPAQIFATGKVEIFGTIDISGLNALPVSQLNSANIPQPGAGTLAGSGKGGRGSPLTTTSSPKGEDGFGAFGVPSGGGTGGEGGYKAGNNDEGRRGGGGGGGSFANPNTIAGNIQAQPGFDGAPNAKGALDDESPPTGGPAGPSVFVDTVVAEYTGSDVFGTTAVQETVENDFFGLFYDPGLDSSDADDVFLLGELDMALAGTGGGGGGDTMKTDSFPSPVFNISNDKKGGGGGSGGGQLQLLSLGDVVLGANAVILADGGNGGEGESTAGTNQVGGGGGGGSGGHLIIQTSGRLDLSAGPANGAVSALGGGGAKGKGDSTSGQGAGGSGGAGVIQIHLVDFSAETDGGAVIPPAGSTADQALDALTAPNAWRLFPSFGNKSRARSTPIPLGALATNTPGLLTLYGFEGINTDAPVGPSDPELGEVLTVAGEVVDLPSLVDETTPGVTVAAIDAVARTVTLDFTAGAVAAIAATGEEYCYDAAGNVVDCAGPDVDTSALFSNDIYFRNADLLENFGVRFTKGAVVRELTVASAELTEVGGGAVTIVLTMASGEGTLGEFVTGGAPDFATFDLIPRYFRVATGGQLDQLPLDQRITIRLRGFGATADGEPDLTTALVDWTPEAAELSRPILLDAVKFVQFEVTFDLDADNDGGVSGNTALPELRFLRLPFRF